MPSAFHTTWQPLFVTEPAAFRRALVQPSLSGRMRAWPCFRDMLVGESVRHGRAADREAMDAVRELYAFGLGNGLPVRERLDAVAAVREHLSGRERGAGFWEAFLCCDPAAEVAVAAAEAFLDADTAAPAALCAMIDARACPARGALLGALLRRGAAELFPLAGPLRHGLDLGEVAEALGCCDAPLPATSQAFLADWLESLDAAEERELTDLLVGGMTRQGTPAPDIRRVAEYFLPVEAATQPILRPAAPEAAPRRAQEGADLPA